MKTKFERVISILTVIIILALKANAASGVHNLPIEKQLEQQIKFPKEVKELSENALVYVAFTIDENGKVVVLNTNASHPQVKNAVVEQLRMVTLESNDFSKGNVYYVKFNFKLIN